MTALLLTVALIEFALAITAVASFLDGRTFEGCLCAGLVILIYFYTLTMTA